MRALDLTGQRFGKLTVIEETDRAACGKRQWICKCDCGGTSVVIGGSLTAGKITSCGCSKIADIVGKKFGRLTVIKATQLRDDHGNIKWECKCDCDNVITVATTYLTQGSVRSCGCLARQNLVSQRFGRLTVIAYDNNQDGRVRWTCQCDCGRVCSVTTHELKSGDTRSCGCYMSEVISDRMKTHGQSNTRLYKIWKQMRQRCQNPSDSSYYMYGALGVRVCPAWNKFETFYDWAMSHNYSEELSLDRINPFRDYCPENCQWATDKQQGINKRVGYFYAVRQGYELNVDKYVSHHNQQVVSEFLQIIFTRKFWAGLFRECDYTLADESSAEALYEFVYSYVALYLHFLNWAFDYYNTKTDQPFEEVEMFALRDEDPRPDITYEGFLRDLQYCFDSLKKEDAQND